MRGQKNEMLPVLERFDSVFGVQCIMKTGQPLNCCLHRNSLHGYQTELQISLHLFLSPPHYLPLPLRHLKFQEKSLINEFH